MADATKLPTKEELLKRLSELEKTAKTFAGHPQFNPHLWINRNVRQLVTTVSTGNITPELANAVLKLELPKLKSVAELQKEDALEKLKAKSVA